ncbi:hypothetical protein IEQ34_018395 [Dendrobium chrysotoxum]|uniref:WRKY domain-containing protein n=1 Tax=Dendrobium chrysotoxum TaxID=161865 RepID=A0AAV7GCW0_DENCH|nr:hypothetical protein IEQ34_018395 [Dendrobium chrysotoxum]
MESGTDKVVSELHQIHELARKLNENLELSHNEICRTLAKEIICAIEKTICTAKSSSTGETELAFFNGREFHVDRLNKEFSDNEPKKSKKRKILANGTRQVRVSSDPGADMPPDDGHSWRKYGQKDILGAKHPRSYYRCTHRKTQGCAAMKQVQKTDENSSIFDITYLGTHSCFNSPQQIASKTRFYNPQQSLLDQQNSLVLHLDFETNLKLKTESSDLENQDPTSSFSFSSTPIERMNSENVLFCSSPRTECRYGVNLSSALMSPTSYESNCFTWPPCEMSSEVDYALTEIISTSNSVADLSVMDVEFMRGYEEMDAEIPFDTSIFFE